ncbi:MAG: DUF3307 domain-containing protein [Cyclobacteriaceae bacterium]|nr:DUF3307 domain-containing protein [Cyclobacteriaceae bacterium]
MILFIKLLLAHLLGDFYLQPKSWVEAKERDKLRSFITYAHASLHGVLAYALVWEKAFLPYAVAIALVHLCIDAIKVYAQKTETKRAWFLIDQSADVLSLIAVTLIYYQDSISWVPWGRKEWVLLTAIVLLTRPTAFLVGIVISRWGNQTNNDNSLEDAGFIIGVIERLMVFTFVVTDHWEGVGLLVAAKSILRLQDDRRLTEYVLVGTLLSFGIAVLSGMAYLSIAT